VTDFLQDLLDDYGTPRVRYSGRGEIASDNVSASIEWAAAQYDDGEVLLACEGDHSLFDVSLSRPKRFNGTSSDGVKFDSPGAIWELPLLRPLPEGRSGAWAVFALSLLHAGFPASGPPGLVRYLLTNFEFDRRGQRAELSLTGVQGAVRLVPDDKDEFASQRLRALRSARPTARLEIMPQFGQAVAARQIADNICNLLSIARGTKVAWIQEELLNTDSVRTHLNHANRITKPFAPSAPIEPTRIGDTAAFLEMTYGVFVERRKVFKLDRGTIDSVLDAKIQTDFLETRGAKLAVALEVLKQNVLLHLQPDMEHHIPPETFARAVSEISIAARDILIRHGVAPDAATAMTTAQRLLSLNRRSFSYLLRKTAKAIGLKLVTSELELFVRCRNSLVHRGNFYSQTATEQERTEVPPKASAIEEYFFLLSFVDAFLLRLVGYHGPYLVRTITQDGGEVRQLEELPLGAPLAP